MNLFNMPIHFILLGGCLFPIVSSILPADIPSLTITKNLLTLIFCQLFTFHQLTIIIIPVLLLCYWVLSHCYGVVFAYGGDLTLFGLNLYLQICLNRQIPRVGLTSGRQLYRCMNADKIPLPLLYSLYWWLSLPYLSHHCLNLYYWEDRIIILLGRCDPQFCWVSGS